MPSLVRCEAVRRDSDLRGHDRLELIVGNFQESEQLSYQHSHIALVDQSEAEVERSPSDTDIGITQTIQDSVAMSLYSVGLDCDNFDESVEGNISDVVVAVGQELSQNIHTEYAKSGIRLDIEDGEYCLV